MGGSVSKGTLVPGQAPYKPVVSREQLLQMTQQPRVLINEIFKTMVEKLTPKDILELSNPKTCSKYIFFMSDAIKQSFLQLQLRPKKDKQGTIYYSMIDELQGKSKDPVLSEKEFNSHCLSVAFFYVRIFQIFGALAMSVSDDVTAGLGFGQRAPVRGQVRGTVGGPAIGVRRPGWFGFGGAMGSEFMSEFDSYNSSTINRFISNYNKLTPYISKYGSTEESRNPANPSEDVDIYTYRFDAHPSLELIIRIKVQNQQQQQFGYAGPYGFQPQGRTSTPEVTLKFESPTLDKDSKKFYIRSSFNYAGTSDGKPKFLISRLEKRVSGISAWSAIRITDSRMTQKEIKLDGTDPAQQIEDYFKKVIESQEGVAPTTVASTTSTDPLATEFIRNAISTKQVSFGSARSIQLLNITTGESRVCYEDFKNFPEFNSLPKSGQGLGSIPAFRAMEILFFNDFRITPDNKFSLLPGSQEAYNTFLTKMMDAFGTKITIDDRSRLDSIKAIASDCGSKKNTVIVVPKDRLKQVVEKTQNIMGIQQSHTTRVLNFILKNLIQKGPGNNYNLQPRLFQIGLPEIDRIAKEAREMLVNHYVQVEKMYKEGVAMVPK